MTKQELISRLEAGDKFDYSVLFRDVRGIGHRTLGELREQFPGQIERDDPMFFASNKLAGTDGNRPAHTVPERDGTSSAFYED